VWDKTPITVAPNNNCMLSADGTRLAADFPWPHAGVADLTRGSWQEYGTGCWVGIAPDNSYRSWVFEGPHKGVMLFDPGVNIRRRIDLSGAPGIAGRAIYHPRWSNHVRVMCMTGPEGGGSQLYVGRFDLNYTCIADWAQITKDSPGVKYPDVWIEGPDPDAHAEPALLPVPNPWREVTVGEGKGGAAVNRIGNFILQSNGRDIYGAADACQFVYQRLQGDCEIVARVVISSDAGPNARLGVIIRSGEGGTRPDAAQVHMVLRPKQDGRASFCVRFMRGQGSTEDERPAQPFGWVRLVRRGDAVTGYISADGLTWNNQGKAVLPLGKDVLLGLCLSSDSDAVATATFDQVVITGTPSKAADAALWPVVTDGLTFAWRQTGAKLGLSGADAWRVEPHNRAIWGVDRAMSTAGGWFDAPGAGEALATAARPSNAVTVEALITTDRLGQSGARILTAGNIRLAQEDSRLLISLRTTTNPDGTPWVDVCPLVAGMPRHIVISYKPGHLFGFLDGVQTFYSDLVAGDLANWTAQPLRVGREMNGLNIWDGHLAYLSLYATALDAAAVARKYEAVKVGLAQRSDAVRLIVEAQLVAAADPPVLATMAPYRRALRVHIYTVNRVESGIEPAPRIAVAHWCVLDGAALPGRQLGQRVRLTLERFTDHPELEGELRTDDPAYGDLPLYYDDTR